MPKIWYWWNRDSCHKLKSMGTWKRVYDALTLEASCDWNSPTITTIIDRSPVRGSPASLGHADLDKIEKSAYNLYLHNFFFKRFSREIYPPLGIIDTDMIEEIIHGTWRNDQPMTSFQPLRNIPWKTSERAKNIRRHLADYFVLNYSLPWQNRWCTYFASNCV